MTNEQKYYLAGLVLGGTIGVLGTVMVATKKKIKNLDLRIAARHVLMDDMAANKNPSVEDLISYIKRGSEIDNMPI